MWIMNEVAAADSTGEAVDRMLPDGGGSEGGFNSVESAAATDNITQNESSSDPNTTTLSSEEGAEPDAIDPSSPQNEEGQPADEHTSLEQATSPLADADSAGDQTDDTATEAANTDEDTQKAETSTESKLPFEEKANWDDEGAPQRFRQEYKQLKQAYLELLDSNPAHTLLENPDKFLEWMGSTSPTATQEVASKIVSASLDAYPEQWVAALAEKHPQVLAKFVSDGKISSLDKLKEELEWVDPEEPQDAADAETKTQQAAAKEKEAQTTPPSFDPLSTPLGQQLLSPIVQTVDSLVAEAGYEIDPKQFEGKKFDELPQDLKRKLVVNQLVPMWVEHRISNTPQTKNLENRIKAFIAAGDETSAKALLHPAKVAITQFVEELLSILGPAADSAKNNTQLAGSQKNGRPAAAATAAAAKAPKQTPVNNAAISPNNISGKAGSSTKTNDDWLEDWEIDWSGQFPNR